jgi:hypothetical protein
MSDPDAVGHYAELGYASPIRVMPEAEARDLVARLERAEGRLGPQVFAKLNAKGHLLFPFLWDVVHDPRIVDVVERILGPDILCWGSSFFSKDAGSAAAVPWHQDGTCWGLDSPRGLTAWLALTPSTPESGCLRVLPTSHREAVPHAVRNAPSSMLPLGEEVAVDVDEKAAVACPLHPGEMSLHHVMLIHGSAPNLGGTERRIGFAIRYIPADVRQRGGTPGWATLVRGRDHGTYRLEQRPAADLDPVALRRHRDILRHSAELVTQEAGRLASSPD